VSHNAPQRVACPTCQQQYPWRPDFAGRKVRCAKCHTIFAMPAAQPAERGVAHPAAATAQAPPPSSGGSGAAPAVARTQPPPAPVHAPEMAQGPTCPSCGVPLAAQAILCVACGYDLRTGFRLAGADAPPAAATQSSPDAPPELPAEAPPLPVPRPESIHNEPVTILSILGVAVRSELAADALVVVLGWLGWIVLLIAASFAAGFISVFGPAGAMLGLLGILLVAAAAYGWLGKQYMSVTQQFESGGLVGNIERSNLHCFGMLLIVSVMAYGPLWAVLRFMPPPGKNPLTLGALILSAVWGLLYWPMGFAVAGAYWTLNPLEVMRKIVRSFPIYLLVLVFIVIVIAATYLLATAALMGTAVLFPGSYMALLTAIGAASLLLQYGLMAAYAMLGMLLRKYRPADSETEPGSAGQPVG